jgi:predicted metal-dependent peptidase
MARIVSLGTEDYTGPVYNFETEDHTYLVHNQVVHNCDLAINQALKTANPPIALPAEAIFPPIGYEDATAEELYDLIQKGTIKRQTGNGPKSPTAGCGVLPSEGNNAITPDQQRKWQEVAAQAKSLGIGNESAKGFVELMDTPPAKVKWRNLIKHSTLLASAMHGRDFQTWAKRSRRSQIRGFQFPGWASSKPTLAIVIDTSGSMSDPVLNQAAQEAATAATLAANVYLVLHDSDVYFKGWLNADTKAGSLKRRFTSRGGTVFTGAYEAVSRIGKPIDVMVNLTDGEAGGAWPRRPINVKHLIVAITGPVANMRVEPPFGSRVVEVEVS